MNKLKKQRQVAKAGITRTEKAVIAIKESSGREANPRNKQELIAREEILIGYFKNYEQVQTEIELLRTSESEAEKDEKDRTEVEDKYFKLIALIKELTKVAPPPSDASSSAEPASNHPNSPYSFTKLPNVVIPEFDGRDIGQYRPFHDLFAALIDKNQSLSDVQKLFYLRTYLKGEANALIANLPLTNDSYEASLQLLDKRYNNTILIVNSHIKNLLETPNLIKGTAQGLREFISRVRQQVDCLKSLNQPVEHWDVILVYILTLKLDSYTNRSYQLEKAENEEPKLNALLDFLEHRATALESAEDTQSKPYRRNCLLSNYSVASSENPDQSSSHKNVNFAV